MLITRMRCFVVLPLLFVLYGISASAQFQREEHTGMTGTFDLGAANVSFDSASPAIRALWGARLAKRWAVNERIRVGGEVSLLFTNLRGMKPGRDAYSFFQGDAGIEASIRAAEMLRIVGHVRTGIRSAERLEGTETWNYTGSGKTIGGGVEIPITPAGRGLSLEVDRLTGHFTSKERLLYIVPVDQSVSAWTFIIGWGGPLTINPFWK